MFKKKKRKMKPSCGPETQFSVSNYGDDSSNTAFPLQSQTAQKVLSFPKQQRMVLCKIAIWWLACKEK